MFGTTDTSAESPTLTRVLDDDRRRFVVRYLSSRDDGVDVASLAAKLQSVLRFEADGDAPGVDTLRVSLHHVHLPMLDRADLCSYDASARRATPTAMDPPVANRLEMVAALLDRVEHLGGDRGPDVGADDSTGRQ